MGPKEYLQLLAIALLCLTHLFVGRLHFLHRSTGWLSFSGGAAAAYVFIYLLPKLGYHQLILAGATPADGLLGFLQHHAYLAALAGFLAYFGASRAGDAAAASAEDRPAGGLSHPLESLHILAAALYAALVGYLFADYHRAGATPILLGIIALTLHFLGADHAVRMRYGRLYDQIIRWLLVGATLTGAAIGALTTLPSTIVALFFAFLAGAVLVNVIETELPDGGRHDIWWFFAGAAAFSALVLVAQSRAFD